MQILEVQEPPLHSGRALRDWLLQLPGVGYKTASWIARNWLDADDVAILDIHVVRAGVLGGYMDASLSVQSDYLLLEAQFLRFSQALGIRASELDAVIWMEMMQSPSTVAQLMEPLRGSFGQALRRRAPKVRDTHAVQASLVD